MVTLHILYFSLNITKTIKSKRGERKEEHLVHVGENISYKVLVGNLKERDGLEDLVIDGRIILELILNKWNGRVWIGFIWLST
jgi:hypothetical protein